MSGQKKSKVSKEKVMCENSYRYDLSRGDDVLLLFEVVANHKDGETVIIQTISPNLNQLEKHYGKTFKSLKLKVKEYIP